MKTLTILFLFLGAFGLYIHSSGVLDELQDKAYVVNNYEVRSLELSKENRFLKQEINELKFKIQGLEAKNNYLTIKLDKKEKNRTVASVKKAEGVLGADKYVKYDTYKWSPKQLAAIGDSEFQKKEYVKSSQFFHTLIKKFPRDVVVTERVLFQAGIAAYESNQNYDWAIEHLSNLIRNKPTSKYYRSAKLWLALSNLRLGNKDKFYETVEEFRLKYRNTDEWEILSGYYEELRHKYK